MNHASQPYIDTHIYIYIYIYIHPTFFLTWLQQFTPFLWIRRLNEYGTNYGKRSSTTGGREVKGAGTITRGHADCAEVYLWGVVVSVRPTHGRGGGHRTGLAAAFSGLQWLRLPGSLQVMQKITFKNQIPNRSESHPWSNPTCPHPPQLHWLIPCVP